jgi:hypothetical protein
MVRAKTEYSNGLSNKVAGLDLGKMKRIKAETVKGAPPAHPPI